MAGTSGRKAGGSGSTEAAGAVGGTTPQNGTGALTQALAGPFGNVFAGPLKDMIALQSQASQAMFDAFLGTGSSRSDETAKDQPEAQAWQRLASQLQQRWEEFQREQGGMPPKPFYNPMAWLLPVERWMERLPVADRELQEKLWNDARAVLESVMAQTASASQGGEEQKKEAPALPRQDRRFADPKWREQPLFALLHQTYLLMSEQMMAAVDSAEGLPPDRQEQLRFATRTLIEALSPANFALTNPVVIERTLESGGENLVRGLDNFIADLKAGQLTHTDKSAFQLGRDIAASPGKVVHETPLFQVIQYSPVTEKVLKIPLVIFPPWINRFYILDLNRRNSFVRWAVEQGITVFMLSWRSADATMADCTWDDYVRAQIETIDFVRARLKVPKVHVIGYCVAGTTLAATLAILAKRGQADRVASATFFTAQVDFADAGELKVFVDEQQLGAIEALAQDGYIDGRYLAATFNLLRGPDLIWNYVTRNYLLGEEYPAFDLLHWNSDVTNLPARWHRDYLRDFYQNNRLVVPDTMSADGTAIDLRRIETPCYIQAGREDHIAPAKSVWKLTRHLSGEWRFILAGSGHIAGVVNPPSSGKYQYWTNDSDPETLEDFIAGATEHQGSWWPNWIAWLRGHDETMVKITGKRRPGCRGDKVIEDAPGRYVATR